MARRVVETAESALRSLAGGTRWTLASLSAAMATFAALGLGGCGDTLWRMAMFNSWNAVRGEHVREGHSRADFGLAIWLEPTRQGRSVWANVHGDDGWGQAGPIETLSGDAQEPDLGLNTTGRAFAVWVQVDGNYSSVWVCSFVEGDGWGYPQEISSGVERVATPRIAVNASGQAVAVWRGHDEGRQNVWVSRFAKGRGWERAWPVRHSAIGDASSPAVGVGETNAIVVAWVQSQRGSPDAVWGMFFQPSVGWSVPQRIDTNAPPARVKHVGVEMVPWGAIVSGYSAECVRGIEDCSGGGKNWSIHLDMENRRWRQDSNPWVQDADADCERARLVDSH